MEKQNQYLTIFERKLLSKTLETDLRPEYRRRLEIMLRADAGQSQSEICQQLGCSQETARYWILMARTGQSHKWNESPVGRPKVVSDRYLKRLRELAIQSPRDYDYSFQNWTAQWLAKHLAKEFGEQVSSCHINRLLKQMGISLKRNNKIVEQKNKSQKKTEIIIRDLQSNAKSDFFWSLNFCKTLNG
jgi:putative transposase